jgi:type II secretory pathway pseudopilin PulG
MKRHARDEGFSLLETMIAATIAGIAFVGTMTAVAVASRFIPQTGLVDTAQERVQSRLEGKQSVRWRSLLMDDLDHDGMPETIMKEWTIEVDPMRPIATVGMATIRSVVTYHGTNGPQQVRMQTIRANPAFLGVPQL